MELNGDTPALEPDFICCAFDDVGDPREQTTRYNHDPSWADEIAGFADAILNDTPVVNGTSEDALKTMELVYRIYCADPEWRDRWNLSDEVSDLS